MTMTAVVRSCFRRRWPAVAGVCGVVLLSPPSAGARAPWPGAPVVEGRGDMAASVRVAPDTGDFAPLGHIVTKIQDPLQCIDFARVEAAQGRRTLAAQVKAAATAADPRTDTLPSRAVAVARSCGQHISAHDPIFSGAQAADNLLNWLSLSLWAMDDSLARAIVTRLLGDNMAALGQGDRPALVRRAVDVYLAATPARVAAAESLVATLDTQAPSALVARIDAHLRLLAFARACFDPALMQAQAAEIMALSGQLTAGEWPAVRRAIVEEVYRDAIAAAAFRTPDSLPVIARRIQAQDHTPPVQQFLQRAGSQATDYSQMRVDQIVQALAPGAAFAGIRQGPRIAPLDIGHLYPARARDTVVPTPGTVSLLLVVPTDRRSYDDVLGQTGYERLNEKIRRWNRRYGTALSITVVATPYGHALLGGAETVAQLGKAFDWYYHEYLHLPVTVAVDSAAVLRQLPAPDGRVFYGPGRLEVALHAKRIRPGPPDYQNFLGGRVIVVDRDGHTVYDSGAGIGATYELGQPLPMLDALLERLCAPDTASPHSRGAAAPRS